VICSARHEKTACTQALQEQAPLPLQHASARTRSGGHGHVSGSPSAVPEEQLQQGEDHHTTRIGPPAQKERRGPGAGGDGFFSAPRSPEGCGAAGQPARCLARSGSRQLEPRMNCQISRRVSSRARITPGYSGHQYSQMCRNQWLVCVFSRPSGSAAGRRCHHRGGKQAPPGMGRKPITGGQRGEARRRGTRERTASTRSRSPRLRHQAAPARYQQSNRDQQQVVRASGSAPRRSLPTSGRP